MEKKLESFIEEVEESAHNVQRHIFTGKPMEDRMKSTGLHPLQYLNRCDFVAGSAAGMAGLIMCFPIDTVKVRMQTRGIGFMDGMRQVYSSRGISGFFRGMSLPMVTNGVLNSIFYGVYGMAIDVLVKDKPYIQNELGEIVNEFRSVTFGNKYGIAYVHSKEAHVEDARATYLDCFLAGCMAGACQLSLGCPVELIKIMLQSQTKRTVYKGPLSCGRYIVHENGIKGLYRGFIPMALRNLAGGSIHCIFMHQVMEAFPQYSSDWWFLLSAAGVCGIVGWWMVVPLDVLKSRIQSQDPHNPTYRGMFDCANRVILRLGIRGLYSGVWPLSFRAFPIHVSNFLTFEYIHTSFKICEGNHHGHVHAKHMHGGHEGGGGGGDGGGAEEDMEEAKRLAEQI